MKKSDLKTGMKVVTRNGEVRIVLLSVVTDYSDQYAQYKNDTGFMVDPIKHSHTWCGLSDYSDDLLSDTTEERDIVEISVPGHPYDIFYQHNGYRVIWKREEKSESQKQLDAVMAKLAELQKEAEQLQETIKKEKK